MKNTITFPNSENPKTYNPIVELKTLFESSGMAKESKHFTLTQYNNGTARIFNFINYWNFKEKKKPDINLIVIVDATSIDTFTVSLTTYLGLAPIITIKNVPSRLVRKWCEELWSVAQRVYAPKHDKKNKRTTMEAEAVRMYQKYNASIVMGLPDWAENSWELNIDDALVKKFDSSFSMYEKRIVI